MSYSTGTLMLGVGAIPSLWKVVYHRRRPHLLPPAKHLRLQAFFTLTGTGPNVPEVQLRYS